MVLIDDRQVDVGLVEDQTDQSIADVLIMPFDGHQLHIVTHITDGSVRTAFRRVQMRQSKGREFRPGVLLVFPSHEVAGLQNLLVDLFEFQWTVGRGRAQLGEKFTEDASLDAAKDPHLAQARSMSSTHRLCLFRWLGDMHVQLIGFTQRICKERSSTS